MGNTVNKTNKNKYHIDNEVKDYGNQSFFVDKAKQSKTFLDKNGFPKELLKKKGVNI